MYTDPLGIMLFALLIFGMVLIVLFIILRARQQQRRQMLTVDEYKEKEEKLMLLYFEVEDMLNGLKEYVENAREVLSLEYDRVQAQVQGLQIAQQAQQAAPPPPEPEPEVEVLLSDAASRQEEPEEYTKSSLYDLAAQMLREGKGAVQIAEELSLSKSEVAMIKRVVR